MEIIIFLVILSNFYCKKRMLVDAFDLLNTMSQNNKLHTLREVVMVINDKYKRSKNEYNIKNAEFQYTLFEGTSDNKYDVKYEICLKIYNFFLKKQEQMLKFYAILDSEEHIVKNNLPIKISIKTEDNSHSISYTTLPTIVTISKLDSIKNFIGLYEICFQIPEEIIKRFKINHIQCDISYILKNNFSLTRDSCDYNFFIYPNNYGKKVDQCDVRVLVPENQNYSVVCHRFCVGKNAEKIFDLTQNSGQNEQHRLNSVFFSSFKPKKNDAYFVNLTKF